MKEDQEFKNAKPMQGEFDIVQLKRVVEIDPDAPKGKPYIFCNNCKSKGSPSTFASYEDYESWEMPQIRWTVWICPKCDSEDCEWVDPYTIRQLIGFWIRKPRISFYIPQTPISPRFHFSIDIEKWKFGKRHHVCRMVDGHVYHRSIKLNVGFIEFLFCYWQ